MRLLWRIYFCFFLSTLLALFATEWYSHRALREFHEDQAARDLLVRARLLESRLPDVSTGVEAGAIDEACKEFGRLAESRVTVVRPDGVVIGDSDRDSTTMENHLDRPEVREALDGRVGKSIRFSDTLRRNLMYLAIPMQREGRVVAVVRASVPLSVVEWSFRALSRRTMLGGVVVAVLFALVAYYLSRQISQPLEDMRRIAERLSGGDFSARAVSPNGGEIGTLARALNSMAAQLNERMETIKRQSREQQAVFSSMSEGVLAVDRGERILHLNEAAARFLEVSPEQARGRDIHETVRHPDLQKFIAATLSATAPLEADIVLYGSGERFLQLHGAVLTDAAGERLGALVVMNDVTRTKRLETVRRDFVANVSHELKTPITALKGCVETMSEGGRLDPVETSNFLGMMKRQVDRLGAIVDDLLSLSRLEHDAERGRILLEPGSVSDVVRRATEELAAAAAAKRIAVDLDCPDGLTAPINSTLLEQAVGNLVENAVKYSGEGTAVRVTVARSDKDVEIRVRDEGPGIEKKHLPRIFERFYRVDQARSRSLGGTGLGLAIVKHIALAHRGSVSVESEPGRGSTFCLRFPRA